MEPFKMKRRRISLFPLVLLLAFSNPLVSGYSGGADPSVCDTMVPGHGKPPQTTPNPYKISLGKTSVQGLEEVDITLSSPSGNVEFKGFLIQVRKVGGDKSVGEFIELSEVDDGTARTMTCFNAKDSAATHTSSDPKKTITVHWLAPNDEDAEYQVYYSVVGENGGTYWTFIPHEEKIRVTRNTQVKTTAAPVTAASPELLQKWKEVYTGCGDTKGCFGMPGKCVEEYDPDSSDPITCDIMVTWANKGGKNEFQLTGRPGGSQQGYVAVGFSEDNFMGKDSVIGCAFRGSKQNPSVDRYFNHEIKTEGNTKNTNPKVGIKDVTGTANIEGNLFCNFIQENHQVPGIDIDFDKSYYLLLSKSPSLSDTTLGKHQSVSDRDRSPQAVHISENIILGASANAWLIQLHGGVMVIAWLLCASTGMFTARYYKQTHTDVMPCGKAFWFLLHTFCMIATVFLTICGAIFIIIQKKGLDLRDWHPILGIIVVGLAILQVLIALCRPHPNTPKRPIFNWIHWGVGNAAHIIGIACIFLAWDLDLADLKKKFADEALWLWIMLALVLFHVLMHIVMSIHTLWADKEMDSNNKKRAMHPGPMKPNGLNSEAPGTGFRTFMLSLYLLVMAAGAIALFVLVFWPKPREDEATS